MAKLLLVEDDNNLREIYEARLSAEGYDIVTAQNGEEALSIAKQERPDLIISDVMMPRISGFEMLDILRNTDELKTTKVIMLTALGQAEDRGRADNLGADKYLVKSQVTLEDIVNAAHALLSDSGSPEATPDTAAESAATPAVAAVVTPETTPSTPESAEPNITTAIPAAAVSVPEPTVETPVSATTESTIVAPSVTPTTVAATDDAATLPTTSAEPPIAVPTPSNTAVDDPVTTTPVTPMAAADDQIVTPAPSATVTVLDPDPIAPSQTPAMPTDLTAPPVEPTVATAPTVTDAIPTEVVTPEAVPVQTIESSIDPQTLATEEAAIEAQIASFAANNDAAAPISTAVDEQASAVAANDAVMAEAMEKLTTPEATVAMPQPDLTAPQETTATTVVPVVETPPATEPVVTPEAQPESVTQITGHKVIQPLSGAESTAPDLEALLAQEEAKEAAVTNQTAAPVVNGTATTPPTTPGVDPNTIAL